MESEPVGAGLPRLRVLGLEDSDVPSFGFFCRGLRLLEVVRAVAGFMVTVPIVPLRGATRLMCQLYVVSTELEASLAVVALPAQVNLECAPRQGQKSTLS